MASIDEAYVLSSSDHSGISLVTNRLTVTNYHSWSLSMKLVLATKSKLGFITGRIVKPAEDTEEYERWFKVDAMVQIWILNSITPELADAFMFSISAHALWLTLQRRFGQSNGPLMYQLNREIATISQGDSSVSVYYTRLNKLWDELHALMPVPDCKCGTQNVVNGITSLNRLMQFLIGLNDVFEQTKGQILAMEPLPTDDKAYSLILGVEKQKEVSKLLGSTPTQSAALLSSQKPAPNNFSGNFDDLVGYLARQTHQSGTKGASGYKKDQSKAYKVCDHCGAKGHLKADCFKLSGEEPDRYKELKKLTINFDAYDDIPVDSTGEDIPPPVNLFSDVDLGEMLQRNITICKYVKPTPIQKHALPILVKGRDLMACAQTGSGKTAAFCFPIISGVLKSRNDLDPGNGSHMVACPLALILSPTRELSCQIFEEARKFASRSGVKIVVAYGGAPISQQFRHLERGVHILVATPGRLVDMIERDRVSLKKIQYLALDEADRMLDMGFEPQVRKIVQQTGMPPPGNRQTMLFSATFPSEIQRLASDFLSNYIFLSVGRVGSSTDLIEQRVEKVEETKKRSYLMDLLKKNWGNRNSGKKPLTIVFVETKKGADILEHLLSMNGFPAIAIHGDKVQMERERALRSFKSGHTPILVATDVASRGLDIPHVAHVINFDMPKDIDAYVHRIGRTGRAGKSGLATALFSDKNIPLASQLVELMKEAKQEIPPWLKEYAESSPYMNSTGGNYGGGKFGGYDFRTHSYGNADTDFPATTSSGGDYLDAGTVQPYADEFEPIGGTGWE